jgi:MoxR-like ATPase
MSSRPRAPSAITAQPSRQFVDDCARPRPLDTLNPTSTDNVAIVATAGTQVGTRRSRPGPLMLNSLTWRPGSGNELLSQRSQPERLTGSITRSKGGREVGAGIDTGADAVPNELAYAAPDEQIAHFASSFEYLSRYVSTVVLGAPGAVRIALTALLARGHLLIEDLPGVGKTTLARTISATIGGVNTRVQFTPDLLPTDVTGYNVFHPGSQTFEFRAGPIFANIVVADEINRASPKVQSALLEVMEERQVTVDGVSYSVPQPFMVIATQNPIELEGTYRLPEAQLDRFLARTSMGLPTPAAEAAMVRADGNVALDHLQPALGVAQIEQLVMIAARVQAEDPVIEYAVEICRASRASPHTRMGASPRATLALIRAARVWAAAEGRGFITPDDVRALAGPVLEHRLEMHAASLVRGVTQQEVIEDAVHSVAAPRHRG